MVTVKITEPGAIKDESGQTIGDVLYEENTIKKIEIDPPYKGQGYGKETIRQFCEDSYALGYDSVYIACITNKKLVGIARSFGGEEVSSHSLPIAPHPMLERDKPDYKIPLPL